MTIQNSSSAAQRLNRFKNKGKDIEDLRRRRNEVTVQLRKQSKDENLVKRRNICNEELVAIYLIQNRKERRPRMSTTSIFVSSQ